MNNIKFPLKIYVKNKGKQILTSDAFVASGGEGSIFRIGSTAYKIYDDPNDMIPTKKIDELNILSYLKNVLGPKDIILNNNQEPIGFTMSYVSDVEFLTRLFNKNYRIQNKVTPEIILSLIKKMQLTLAEIHKCGILVVDFNEMNSVTNKKYDDIFFIDVNSYQTKTYKATALMESVRDRKISNKQFTEGSDWFSFAIVSFQLYMNYHPYGKGKYKTYTSKDLPRRMDENISIFHPEVILSDMWKDFSIIPKAHFEWYKEVFHKGNRNPPPLPDSTPMFTLMPTISIINSKTFTVTKLFNFQEPIKRFYYINGYSITITEKGIYEGVKKVISNSDNIVSVIMSTNDDIVIVKKNNDTVYFIINNETIGEVCANQIMHYKNKIYTTWNNHLTEHRVEYTGHKSIHLMKNVSNIFRPASALYSGVVIQNIIGKCWVAIPYSGGKCFNGPIPDLDNQRIIEAKFEHHILIVITEKANIYYRYIISFNENFSEYSVRKENNDGDLTANFTCLANGICIHIFNDDYIEVFKDNNKIKKISDPPITTDICLLNDSDTVLFINNKDIYRLKMT